jgi:hypothetical protein
MSAGGIWFTLSREEAEPFFGEEYYILAQSRVPATLPEDDLFAGIP